MELLLILTYTAVCYAIFKIFRIPVNQWSLATAALGGIIGIALLLLLMNYNHPYTANARIYFAVTPILPGVRGRVVEVPVEANTPLKQGTVLFTIDPKPYEFVVQQKKASLIESEQNVKRLKASFEEASAATERAKSQVALAQQNFDRQEELFAKNVIAKATLETFARNLEVSTQTWEAAKSARESAQLAYSVNVDGVNTTVARLRAELGDALYDLEQTVVRAPGDGFVTQVALRAGVYVVPVPLRPAMVFVNSGERDRALSAAFQQNALQRVKAGDDAEVAFDAVPGQVFRARVRLVLDAIGAGQIAASGTLQDLGAQVDGGGRAVAVIDVLDDISGFQIPLGAAAGVAIYTHHWHHLSVLRKILLRMKSWQNYVFMEAH
jgi:multidrug resistance efflux pump